MGAPRRKSRKGLPLTTPKNFLPRYALAWSLAIATTLSGMSAAHAAEPSWRRIEQLIDAHAYSVARLELASHLAALKGDDLQTGRYWLGFVERRLGNAAAAEAALVKVDARSLWYPKARLELSRLYLAEKRIPEGLDVLKRLIPELTGDQRDAVRQTYADLLFSEGKAFESIDPYRELAERSPSPARREHAAYALGWVYDRLENPARAVWSWKEALRLYPASPHADAARAALANQYVKLAKPLLAADVLRGYPQEAFTGDLKARAEYLAGEGYAQGGNWKMAIAAYSQVPPGTKWSDDAAYGLAYARWQAGDPVRAAKDLETWLAKHPASPTRPAALYALGRIREDAGKLDEAAKWYAQAAKLPSAGPAAPSPWAEAALYQGARLQFNRGQHAAALALAKTLIAQYPDGRFRGPARWIAAECLLATKQFDAAIAGYAALAKEEPDLGFLDGKADSVTFRLGLAHVRAGDHAAAVGYLSQVAGNPRYGEDATFWMAEALYRSGGIDEARETYEAFLKRFPKSERAGAAAYGAAWCAYRQEKWEAARGAFRRASTLLAGRDDGAALRQDALYRLGVLSANAHDWSEAQGAFKQLLAATPDDAQAAEARFQVAFASYRIGRLEEAVLGLEDFLTRHPKHVRSATARSTMGQALFRLGKFEPAVAAFEGVLADANATPEAILDARSRIGAASFNSGNLDRAIATYRALLNDASGSAEVRAQVLQPLAQAELARGNLAEARLLATQEASASLWSADVLGKVAQGFMERGQPKDALLALEAIADPTLEQRYLLVQARKAAGDQAGALALLKVLVAEPGPQQPTWLYELGEAHAERGQLDEARSAWDELAKRHPGHPLAPKAQVNLAQAYLKVGQEKTALATYELIAKRFAGDTPLARAAWMRIGQLQLKHSQYSEAAHAYRQAERLSEKGSGPAVQARYWLGYTMVAAKRYEDAVKELQTLSVPPEAGLEWQALAWLKQGEALEQLRRWKEAEKVYEKLMAAAGLPASEKQEARARLEWIAKNVNGRRP
jgi:TolA-binding protein